MPYVKLYNILDQISWAQVIQSRLHIPDLVFWASRIQEGLSFYIFYFLSG